MTDRVLETVIPLLILHTLRTHYGMTVNSFLCVLAQVRIVVTQSDPFFLDDGN